MTGRIGMALPLAAMLGLLLLIPVHHGHALHDVLTAGGEASIHSHHSEQGGGSHPDDEHSPSLRCPVCVFGKATAALVPPVAPLVLAFEGADGAEHVPWDSVVPVTRHEVSAQPRAPPFSMA